MIPNCHSAGRRSVTLMTSWSNEDGLPQTEDATACGGWRTHNFTSH